MSIHRAFSYEAIHCLPNDFCTINIPKHKLILYVSMVAPYFNFVPDETQRNIRKINFHNYNKLNHFIDLGIGYLPFPQQPYLNELVGLRAFEKHLVQP